MLPSLFNGKPTSVYRIQATLLSGLLFASANNNFYAVMEFNWYHWTRSGHSTATAGLEGVDLLNLGSTGVVGNDIVTGAVGIKWLRRENREFGVAFEMPLTQRRDIFENRLTADYIIRY